MARAKRRGFRLVRFAGQSRRPLLNGLAVLGKLDNELQAALGERGMAQLARQLGAALTLLEGLAKHESG